MNANDVMNSDLVYTNKFEVCTVIGTLGSCIGVTSGANKYCILNERLIHPIPITKKWMEDNFEVTYNNSNVLKSHDCPLFIIPRSNNKSTVAFWSHGNGTPFVKVADVHFIRCYYVHQLQHLLKLMNSPKVITN